VFSAVYGGNSRVKQHHSGVVGRVLDKEMGKEFFRALGHSAMHRAEGFMFIIPLV
jgi:hypothetical protein